MQKQMDVPEFEQRVREVLREVSQERTAYLLSGDGRPQAAIIPYDEFVRLQRLDEQGVLDRFDRTLERMARANSRFSEDEVARDVEEARLEVRAERGR